MGSGDLDTANYVDIVILYLRKNWCLLLIGSLVRERGTENSLQVFGTSIGQWDART